MGSWLSCTDREARIETDATHANFRLGKLKEENEYLKTLNDELREQLQETKRQGESKADDGNLTMTKLSSAELRKASERKITEFVEGILADPNKNIRWLPDAVERRLYNNVAHVALNLVESMLEGTGVEILGHRVRFVVDPITG